MKKLLVALLAVEMFGCGTKEPEYQGKPVSTWVRTLDQGAPPAKAQAANLLAEAGKVDPTVVHGLIGSVKNGSFAAADVLGRIGHNAPAGSAKDAVTALSNEAKVKGNARNSIRLACARAIPKFGIAGKDGVPGLLEMLRDDDPVIRRQAAESLGQLPPDAAKEAVNELVTVARGDQALDVQQAAIEAVKALDAKALDPPKK